MFRRDRGGENRRRHRRRWSTFEQLESRQMLSGVVSVLKTDGNLLLEGDCSNNAIEVRQLETVGRFEVVGKYGTSVDDGTGVPKASTIVNGINGDVTVSLKEGNDSFELLGSSLGGQSIIVGDLVIENGWGSNLNVLNDVRVNMDFTVQRALPGGILSYSELEIVDTLIQGNTTIANDYLDSGGDSRTIIQSSDLQGTLTITNGCGKDLIDIRATEVNKCAGGLTTIVNRDGGSRTTFTANGHGTVLYGPLSISNGTNLAENDTVTFNQTEVYGAVTIDNGHGNTVVSVDNGTVLGSDLLYDAPVTVMNQSGYDEFTMNRSEAPWGLSIHHSAMSCSPLRTTTPGNGSGDYYGSSTDISESLIGLHPLHPGDLVVIGDNFDDYVSLMDTRVGGTVQLCLFDGNNAVSILETSEPEATIFGALSISCGSGNDRVSMNGLRVLTSASVTLGYCVDSLEILNSVFDGPVVFDGGAGLADQYRAVDSIFGDHVTITSFELFG